MTNSPDPSVGGRPAAPVDVSVILVNYNTEALLQPCLDKLAEALVGLRHQVFIVDNASRDGSLRLLHERYSHYEIVENRVNVGFGRANNQVLERVRGRYVLLLNLDAFIEPDAIVKSIAYLDEHARCGVLGARLVDAEGHLQPSCRYFPTPWNLFLERTGAHRIFPGVRMIDDFSWDHASPRICDWVPGCFYLIRKEVIDAVGLFDPRYFLYWEEVDHCRAVNRAGWNVVYFPGTTVVHIGGESAKSESELTGGRQISELQIESQLLYFRKHYGRAGAWAGLGLMVLAEALVALKSILLGRPWRRAAERWREMRMNLRAFRRTGGGRVPAR
jgi:GT2 family glycosyltransferase